MCAYQGWSVIAQLSSHSKSMSNGQCHKVLCITKTPTWHANFSATETHLTAAPLASLPPWPENPAPSSAHLPSQHLPNIVVTYEIRVFLKGAQKEVFSSI